MTAATGATTGSAAAAPSAAATATTTATATAAAAAKETLVLRPTKAPVEKRRLDYKPPDFLIDQVYLHFILDAEKTKVISTLSMRRRPNTPPGNLRLDGESLDLQYLSVDGKEVPRGAPCSGAPPSGDSSSAGYSLDEEGALFIPSSLLPEEAGKPFKVKTEVYIHPKTNLKLSGLYVTNDLLCTQCEAEGFRRITFFLDRPDVMALYTVRLEGDASLYPTLLSNGNLIESGPVAEETAAAAAAAGAAAGGETAAATKRHYAVFEDPFKKPCYLFALVAGPLNSIEDTFLTKDGRKVRVCLYSEPCAPVSRLQYALGCVLKSMKWDEEAFGRIYDLDTFRVVSVRDFNMGAMENKGLNIFNAALLLADPATTTDAEFERILGVVGHEYFHNWSGNRVTCRDWFQLTLKEGLTVYRDQLFSAAMGSAAVKRIEDVCYLRAHQFAEDSGPMSHPIRPETYIAMDNFYTLTVYEKGAEVIRMLSTLLGTDGFRKGTDLYFERHDGQAVTCDDFLAAMADANKKDLKQFERWYSQAGTPEIEVLECKYDSSGKRLTLKLKQQTPPTPGQPQKQPLLIPVRVGLIGRESKKDILTPPSKVLELTEAEQTFTFEGIEEPCVVSLFRDFSAPVRVKPWLSDEETAFLMAYDSDAFNRWEAANALARKLLLKRATLLTNSSSSSNSSSKELESPPLSELYLEAFKTALLDKDVDKSIKALTLQLPSFEVLAQELRPIDPEAIHAAISSSRLLLCSRFFKELSEVYRELTISTETEETLEPQQVARRRLRNVLLRLIVAKGDSEAAETAYKHYTDAKCMTDKYAALLALADIQHPHREKAFQQFFDETNDDPLLLDKWFRAQAASDLPDAVERVSSLQQHPAFTLKNPNRMRALLGVFTLNRRHFHRKDGAGYKLIADAVVQVDTFNPQAAARLAGAFLQWRHFDEERQQMMKAQLQRIKDTPGLSPDTLEIVQRALKPTEAETQNEKKAEN